MCATHSAIARRARHARAGSAHRSARVGNVPQPATKERGVLRRLGRVSMPPALVLNDVGGSKGLPAAVTVRDSVSPHRDFTNPVGQDENDSGVEAIALADLSIGAGILTRRQQRILYKALGGSQPTPEL